MLYRPHPGDGITWFIFTMKPIRYAIIQTVAWTATVGLSLGLFYVSAKKQAWELAKKEAITILNKDMAFRDWASRHGGVYVPPSAETPPNPYLSHLPERDITTSSGKKLTLMNPAYMLRQIQEEFSAAYGIRGHITSLKLLNPNNQPDDWEDTALLRLEQGMAEVSEQTQADGSPYLRLMVPMVTKRGCLKCHGDQGYQEGQIRGGVSMTIPVQPYLMLARQSLLPTVVMHGVIWLLGMAGIFLLTQKQHRWIREREKSSERLRLAFEELEDKVNERTSELGQANAELEKKNREISNTSQELQRAIDKFSALIQRVTVEQDFKIDFTYDFSEKCYEVMACDQTDCAYYGKDAGSCWNEVGSFGAEQIKYHFSQEYGSCNQCKYFKRMTTNPINMIAEQFNNMMHILEGKNSALQTAYSELKQAQSHLLQGEKMASIGQLAAGVAHEINNPVGFIHSNLSTLAKYLGRFTEYIAAQQAAISDLSEEVRQGLTAKAKELKIEYSLKDARELIGECLEGTDRVKEITMNLKNFSRVDHQEQQAANLNTCLDETLRIVWNELKYKATVTKEYGELPETVCYPQQLNQVFVNILVNAAQALIDKGEIRIRTWAEHGSIFIAISDTGPGIPEAIRHRLFEPFFTTKEVGKGTGLGLSISYDIVKKHGGEITLDSVEGRGTTFTIQIPVCERDVISG